MEGRFDVVQHKCFARGIEDKDVIAIAGGSDAIILVFAALVLETKVVGTVFGGLL